VLTHVNYGSFQSTCKDPRRDWLDQLTHVDGVIFRRDDALVDNVVAIQSLKNLSEGVLTHVNYGPFQSTCKDTRRDWLGQSTHVDATREKSGSPKWHAYSVLLNLRPQPSTTEPKISPKVNPTRLKPAENQPTRRWILMSMALLGSLESFARK
jgi:hypothetical protein